MRKLTIILIVALIVLASATVALAYPGTVLWKDECPPWATVRITQGADGWTGVECLTFDMESRRK